MTVFLQGVRYKTGRVVREADPYGCVTRGAVRRRGEGTPPYNSNFCRAGPVCPAGAGEESPSHGFAVPGQIVKQVQHFLIEKALLGRASRGIFWGGN